jgi:hypothetical protein
MRFAPAFGSVLIIASRASLPPTYRRGEHEVTITLVPSSRRKLPTRKFNVEDLPKHDIPWDDSISLRREDMYDDDGR